MDINGKLKERGEEIVDTDLWVKEVTDEKELIQ